MVFQCPSFCRKIPFCRHQPSFWQSKHNLYDINSFFEKEFRTWMQMKTFSIVGSKDSLMFFFGGQISCGWHSSEDLAQNRFDMVWSELLQGNEMGTTSKSQMLPAQLCFEKNVSLQNVGLYKMVYVYIRELGQSILEWAHISLQNGSWISHHILTIW